MERPSETEENNGGGEKEAKFAIWDCGSPLYDSYELVSFSLQIERHLMKLPYLGSSKRLTSTGTRFSYLPDVVPATIAGTPTSNARAKVFSSLMSSLGEFLGSKFLKRIRFGQKRNKL
ncbi:hypothetical protein HRI_001262000 [Hibiscus trionum]|uniref:Uncharacterized protein n=1 Tax=Hibiscus trionum TaxID=183268 RepID=A0A9W7HFC0_HIBTR|nr:hypothetical protein HRI_001262000 [Hibiscus trionum]